MLVYSQVKDLTENRDILNKYNISIFRDINSLNIEIRLIGFNENTSLIKNRILSLCMHEYLYKNKPVNVDFVS